MKKKLVVVAGLLLLAPVANAAQIIVKERPSAAPQVAERELSAVNGRLKKVLPRLEAKVFELPDQVNVEQMLERLRRNPNFQYAEKDHIAHINLMPNDAYYGNQWHHKRIGSEAAWDVARGDNVTIAVIDTGVNNVADFNGRLLPGFNTQANSTNTADTQGHGTAVAGVAAAAGNNAVGVAGMAWNAKILPLRITPEGGSYAYYSDMAAAITYAADHGAQVMNLSFGVTQWSDTINNATKYAWDRGALVTHSAGNEGVSIATSNYPYMITVSATDQNDAKAGFSNWGNFVDFAAPGVNVVTTRADGTYSGWNGTSFSAPMTAGLIALIKSKAPSMTPAQIVDLLKQTATDLGAPGYDSIFGFGRINAQAALARLNTTTTTSPTPTTTTSPTPTTTTSPTPTTTTAPAPADTTLPTATVTAPKNGAYVRGIVNVTVATSDNVAVTRCEILVNNVVRQTVNGTKVGGCSLAWDTTRLANGYYTLTARATDAAGNSRSSSVRVYRY